MAASDKEWARDGAHGFGIRSAFYCLNFISEDQNFMCANTSVYTVHTQAHTHTHPIDVNRNVYNVERFSV